MRGQPPGKSNEMRQQTTFARHCCFYIYLARKREREKEQLVEIAF